MTSLAACRALVLDDHPLQCLSLRDLLRQACVGHVDTAESAAAALECLRDAHYDLVLTDIRMPGMDGAQFIRELAGLLLGFLGTALVIRKAFHELNLARPADSEPLHGVDADRIADRFESYLNETMRLKPLAIETLQGLAARGLALALLTNGSSRTQRRKISQFNLARHFQTIRIEEEAGIGKPDPAAYHGTLDALGLTAQDAWMIGDDPVWDVGMPRRLGMGAILFDDLGGREADPDAPPHATLTRLCDLLILVDQAA